MKKACVFVTQEMEGLAQSRGPAGVAREKHFRGHERGRGQSLPARSSQLRRIFKLGGRGPADTSVSSGGWPRPQPERRRPAQRRHWCTGESVTCQGPWPLPGPQVTTPSKKLREGPAFPGHRAPQKRGFPLRVQESQMENQRGSQPRAGSDRPWVLSGKKERETLYQ